MRVSTVLAAVTFATLVAARAAAEEPPPPPDESPDGPRGIRAVDERLKKFLDEPSESLGVTYVGMRAGYAIPFGKMRSSLSEGDVMMDENVSGAIPVWLDAEYAPLPELVLGLTMIMGPAFPVAAAESADPDAELSAIRGCPEGGSCSSFMLRPGAHVAIHPWPQARVDPWLAAGLGYEWFLFKLNDSGRRYHLFYHGPEIPNTQLGLDLRLTKSTWLGLFGAFELGRYVGCGMRSNHRPQGCNIIDKRWHEWLTVGLRVRTLLWRIRRSSAVTQRM
ncbi:MAG: hypothetical protein JW751_28700 [Polyangiaceae bacterium]|nr:hypothetical protein [Polyangiaceae bacterium]